MVKKIQNEVTKQVVWQPLLDRLGEAAFAVSQKFGEGVVFHIAKPETVAKWHRVAASLDAAIQDGDYDTIKQKSESLIRGWQLLADEAEAYIKNNPITEIWYIADPSGVEYAIFKNAKDAKIWAGMHPEKVNIIHTIEDVAKILHDQSQKIFTKTEAEILADSIKRYRPKSTLGELLDDEIPFW